ncbi:MAG: hypothetical protein NTZ13_01115 [Candidatus Parcubacteria bacterium]|nr:hypothetical protein [Candidatus Parcubacteria bacterium]
MQPHKKRDIFSNLFTYNMMQSSDYSHLTSDDNEELEEVSPLNPSLFAEEDDDTDDEPLLLDEEEDDEDEEEDDIVGGGDDY